MATGLIDIMKRAALEANENAKPCDLRFGTVTSTNPIKIHVTPQFILPESALIIPKRLTDYDINITTTGCGWETENKSGGSGDSGGSGGGSGRGKKRLGRKSGGACRADRGGTV